MKTQIKKVFLDTETTGIDPIKNGPHQIAGCIEIDGVIKEMFNIKFRPHNEAIFEQEALDTCGLTKEEIMSRELSENDAYNQLTRIFLKYVNKFDKKDKFFFYAYNASFDKQMMVEMWLRNHDTYFFSLFWGNHIDIMSLAGETLINRRVNMENFKLLTVARELNIVINESRLHDAEYDTEIMMDIYSLCKPDNFQVRKKIVNQYSQNKPNIESIDTTPLPKNISPLSKEEMEAAQKDIDREKALMNDFINPAPVAKPIQTIYDNTPKLIKLGYNDKDLAYKINFGKHNGRKISELLSIDPGYIVWLNDNTIRGFVFDSYIMTEALKGQQIEKKNFINNKQNNYNHNSIPSSSFRDEEFVDDGKDDLPF